MNRITILDRTTTNINCIIPCIIHTLDQPCSSCKTEEIVLRGTSFKGNSITMVIGTDRVFISGADEDIKEILDMRKRHCPDEI